MWQPSVLLFTLLRHKFTRLRQSDILLRIAPLNNACATTADNQDMNHLHVLLRELYPPNNATLVVELDIFKVFTIPKCWDVASSRIFHSWMSYFEGAARGQPEMLRKNFLSMVDFTQFISSSRIVDALVISLVIVKMAQLAMVVSLLVHLLQAVHSTRRLCHPSSAILVEVPII